MKSVKIYYDEKHRPKAKEFVLAMYSSAKRSGIAVEVMKEYEPFKGVFVCYGCGRPDLNALLDRHVAAGQRAINIDVGYWGNCFRFSVDGLHPSFLPEADAARFDKQSMKITNTYDPSGPIILVGLGPKSRHMDRTWEEDKLIEIEEQLPGREVIYRPKPNRPYPPVAVKKVDDKTPIDQLLVGASLVVTRHSNVGVDACFQGIPVCTETGAASTLYGNDLLNPSNPTEEERVAFLRKLAWWNWTLDEAKTACIWNWLKLAIPRIPSITGLSKAQ